jgi:hypothetical protein
MAVEYHSFNKPINLTLKVHYYHFFFLYRFRNYTYEVTDALHK